MALKKCPRCELNYILDGGDYCVVCRRELKGDHDVEIGLEMCSVCNENPALPGKDLCAYCLKEMEKSHDDDTDDRDENASVSAAMEMDDASTMEEIVLDTDDDDIPERELGEIDHELSLDEMREDEENDEDEDSEEDN